MDVVKVFFGVVLGILAVSAVVALAAAFAALFSPIVLIIGAIALIAAGFYYAYTRFETFRNIVDAVVRFLRDTVAPAMVTAFNFVKDAVGAFVGFFQERMDAVKAALVNIREFMAGVLDFLKFLWRNFGDNVLNYVKALFDGIKTVIEGVLKVIKGVIDVFLGILSGDWRRAWDGIKNIVSGIMGAIKGVIQTAVAPIVYVFGLIGEGIGMALGVLKNAVSVALNKIKDTFRSVFNVVFDIVTAIFGKIGTTVKGVFQGIINGIIAGINFFIRAANVMIRAANRIPKVNIPEINQLQPVALAKGGIVTGPTFALIGEAGPEAVVPLSGPYMPDFLQNDGGGGTTININVQAGLVSSPDQVGQQIIEAIRRAERRSGQVFAAA
jgi:phage-related protein